MGRHKEFDPDEALDKAMMAFWRHGYASTTMATLVKDTGVVRASLYATFGNKAAIFELALTRYGKRQAARIGGVPKEQLLERWFEVTIADAEKDDIPGGCLLITAASDFVSLPPQIQTVINRHMGQLRSFFRFCVQKDGEPESEALDTLVEALHAANIGLYVLSRSGATTAQLRRVADNALDMVAARG